jgi:hypothetical protein
MHSRVKIMLRVIVVFRTTLVVIIFYVKNMIRRCDTSPSVIPIFEIQKIWYHLGITVIPGQPGRGYHIGDTKLVSPMLVLPTVTNLQMIPISRMIITALRAGLRGFLNSSPKIRENWYQLRVFLYHAVIFGRYPDLVSVIQIPIS